MQEDELHEARDLYMSNLASIGEALATDPDNIELRQVKVTLFFFLINQISFVQYLTECDYILMFSCTGASRAPDSIKSHEHSSSGRCLHQQQDHRHLFLSSPSSSCTTTQQSYHHQQRAYPSKKSLRNFRTRFCYTCSGISLSASLPPPAEQP